MAASKLILFLLLMAAVMFVSPALLMMAFLAVFLISIFFKRSLRKTIAKLRPALFFGVIILLMYTLATELYSGLALALRFILVFWLAQEMVEQVPLFGVIGGMARWKPYNPFFRRLSMMIFVAGVTFPIMIREARNIIDAHVSRGIDFNEGNAGNRLKNLLYFLNVFFIKVFDRVDALSLAVESRIPDLA